MRNLKEASPEGVADCQAWANAIPKDIAEQIFGEDILMIYDEKAEATGLFIAGFNAVAERINKWADEKGWNSDDPLILFDKLKAAGCDILTEGEKQSMLANYDVSKFGLMTTEIAETIEARRHNDPPSDKIPAFTGQEEELADCIVRIMHHAAHRKLRVAEALIAKLEYNNNRPYKHNKLV